jgi:hypothetical protein
MSEMLFPAVACLALIGALLLSTSRWPPVAIGAATLLFMGGLLWPVVVYFGADLQAGFFSEAAWPPGAVSTIVAWAGIVVADIVGFLALAAILWFHPSPETNRTS